MLSLGVTILVCLVGSCMGTPLTRVDSEEQVPNIPGLIFLGSTPTKQLFISKNRTGSFQYALGFGCPYIFGSENNLSLTLAAIETLEEVEFVDRYFAETQSPDLPVEAVWTSGIDRLGAIRQWASTGKEIDSYPSRFQGDWQLGQEYSPAVANYNCVAIWRYCDRLGHGPTIPACRHIPYGTWFTPRPCKEERRYICERRI